MSLHPPAPEPWQTRSHSAPSVTFRRAVRFDEVDAAGIVYFPTTISYGHEAMEHFFNETIDGGYAGLIVLRRVGFPAVRLESDFEAPLRYGDVVDVDVKLAKVGGRSAVFRYELRRSDGQRCATIHHTVVVTDLTAMKTCDMPADVREVLERHSM